jgi:hypothetical protein
VIYGWDPDAPTPDGYQLDSDLNGGLLGSGIALLASSWTISILVGVVATSIESHQDDDEAAGTSTGTTAADWSPLFIPLAGPFVSIGTLGARGAGLGLLVADGLAQAAGLAGIIGGVLDRQYKLVPTEAAELGLSPVLDGTMHGLLLTGRFQ